MSRKQQLHRPGPQPGPPADDPEIIRRKLRRLSERVGAPLRAGGAAVRAVVAQLRTASVRAIIRARTLREPINLFHVIYVTACEHYAGAGLERVRLRMVGVRVEDLSPAGEAPRQLASDEPEHCWRAAEQAMDQVAGRFGRGAVRSAALVRRAVAAGDGRDGRDGTR